MRRTTVMLPEEVDARLRQEARRRGIALAELAREAITAYLPDGETGDLGFFAVGEGEPDDVGARSGEFVRDAVARRHSRR